MLLKAVHTTVYNSPIFWVGIGSPFVLALILGFSMSKRAEKQSERTIKNEVKKSKEKTNDLLNSAKIAFDNGDLLTYYSLLEKSIQRSVALLIHGDEHVSLSKQDILVGLQEMNIDEMTISRLKLILERCEQARFGMGVDLSETKDLTESVNDTLQSLHRS
jgi:hypothetical protein